MRIYRYNRVNRIQNPCLTVDVTTVHSICSSRVRQHLIAVKTESIRIRAPSDPLYLYCRSGPDPEPVSRRCTRTSYITTTLVHIFLSFLHQ
jgi:hypothetical protein